VSAPTRIRLDAAFVPFAHARDEDSARDGEHTQAGFNLQLLKLESQRFSLLLSLAHRW
jgi:hypothetical protein